jgi:O-succinylbenzoic acid--CoA ligase
VHLPNWLAQRAALSPHRPALILPGEILTFADLEERAAHLDRLLAAAGIGAGDRVATLHSSTGDFVLLVHALVRRGAILMPLNSRLAGAELSWQLRCGAARLIFDEPHAVPARAATRDMRGLRLLAAEDVRGRPADGGGSRSEPAEIPPIDLDAIHSIVFTSGTTGRPKGAMLTYGNNWWNAVGSTLNLGLHADDRWLACLPLFHVGGLAILWRSVICGLPVVLHESFDPARVNQAIDAERITIVSLVPAMLQRMLAERVDRPYPPALRCILLGGGPAPRPLLERCAAQGIPVFQTYGLTEAASQVATLSPEDALRKLGSAGKPLFPTELRIDGDGQSAAGEIIIRGPTVIGGYLDEQGTISGRQEDGWFHTGDLGYLDAEGYLYVLDRRDDLIVSGGENVYPKEIEDVLLAHPAVADAGVYGIADETWGKVPAAAVVLRPGISVTESDLIDHCRDQLARFKVPVSVRFLDQLPRNAAGKLQRARLQESGREA